MKIAIVGSRNFKKLQLVIDHVQTLTKDTTIISGGAFGVDSVAEQTALDLGMKVEVHYPEWKKYGKAAGPIRNEIIIKNADQVMAFWDGCSKGTLSSIKIAQELNKPLTIIYDA